MRIVLVHTFCILTVTGGFLEITVSGLVCYLHTDSSTGRITMLPNGKPCRSCYTFRGTVNSVPSKHI